MKDSTLSAVNFSKRLTAFFIDSLLICLARSIILQISANYWLRKNIINFVNDFRDIFGANFKSANISSIHLRFFMSTNLFPKIILLCIFLLSLSFIYNLILLSSKWSATIGQKIVGIFAVSKNGTKMRWYQILLRSFLAPLPLVGFFVLSAYQVLGEIELIKALNPQTFLLIIGIGFLAWYDLFFFTEDKLLGHDLLSGTKIVKKGEFTKGFFDKAFEFIDKLTPNLGKLIKKIFSIFKKSKKNIANTNKKRKKKKKTKKK